MATTGKTGQKAKTIWRRLLTAGAALGLALTTMAGCSTTPTTATQSNDPLYGSRTPPGTVVPPQTPPQPTAAIAPPGAPQANNNVGVAPLTSAAPGASNTANLAGTSWQSPLAPIPLNNTGNGPPFVPQTTSSSKSPPPDPNYVPPNDHPRVEPVPDAKTPGAPNAPIAPIPNWQAPAQTNPPIVRTANSVPVIDYAKQLQDRGVIDQKVEQVPNGVQLTCYGPRDAEGRPRISQVTAPDYARAAQAILNEFDGKR